MLQVFDARFDCPLRNNVFLECLARVDCVSFCFIKKAGLTTTHNDLQLLTWFRSIIKVDKPTDTVSLVCIRVKILSVRPIVADSAGTKLPICAKNTIKPTCKNKIIYGT